MLSLLWALHSAACSDSGWSNGPKDPAAAFTHNYKKIVVEVDYEPGAEPDVAFRDGTPTWVLFDENATALFSNTEASIETPMGLADMERIDDQTKTDFSTSDVLDVAERYLTQQATADQLVFYVVFLDGYYQSGGKRQSAVLGITIAEKRVTAIFKPVVNANPNMLLREFVEQSTLIHEFGHAVGLVNNGLPMVNPHQDVTHGAHCTNANCVMYYLNEGVSDLLAFITRINLTGSSVMFGPECLADTSAASTKAAK